MAKNILQNLENLEIEFEKVDQLWETDLVDARDALKCMNGIKQNQIEAFALENGKLTKYISERVFPTTGDGYYTVVNKTLCLMSEKVFNAKLKRKLDAKNKGIVVKAIHDNDGLYHCDVFETDELVDKANKRINLSRRFNYEYNAEAAVDEVNGKKILEFIKEVICSNKDDQYNCIFDIMACASHRVQSGVVLFLCALGGVGKTFFCDILRELFGEAFANSNEQILSGECQFNKILIGSVFACLEETAGTENYLRLMRSMKEMATSKVLMGREMFVDAYPVKNLINIIVLSNHFKDIDIGDRRVFTPEIDNKYQNDVEYFGALKNAISKESLQYVFNTIYNKKVAVPLKVPETAVKEEYKEAHMHTVIKFLLDEYLLSMQYEEKHMKLKDLWERYQVYCKNNKAICVKKDSFYHTMKQYVPNAIKNDKKRVLDGYELYDVSYKTLFDRIIVRSKIVTADRLEQMKLEYIEAHRNAVDDNIDIDFGRIPVNIETQTDDLNESFASFKKSKIIIKLIEQADELAAQNLKLLERIEELEMQLKKSTEPISESKSSKTKSKTALYSEKQKDIKLKSGWNYLTECLEN